LIWFTLARLPFAAGRTFATLLPLATFLAFRPFGALLALKALLALAAVFARLTRFAAFTAALGAETVAAAAIAATTKITVATLELAVLLALAEFRVSLIAGFGVGFALAAFALAGAIFVAFILGFGAEALANLRRRHRRLHAAHEAEIVIRVLHVVFAQHTVARGSRVARELQIALIDRRGVAANLAAFRAIALHGAVGVLIVIIVVMPTTAARLPTATTLTLH
jgi:hypothetical protein